MNNRLVLSPEAITWLGSAFSEKTNISPLKTISRLGFSEEDKTALINQGVIDKDSAFTPLGYTIFDALAKAEAYASFRLSGPFGNIDKTAYFNQDKTIILDNAGTELVISSSPDVENMAGIINEITGISRLVNAELNLKMGVKSALAFATLIDVTRKHAILQYAGVEDMPVGYKESLLIEFLQNADGSRWLTAYIKSLHLPRVALGADELDAALSGIMEAGYAEKGDYGYRLIGEAYDFAVNFMSIENILHMRCGQEIDGKILTGEAMFLQSGLHDVIMLDVDAESIEFNTVSTFTMVEYLQAMMMKAPEFR